MSGIFGIFLRDGGSVSPDVMEAMGTAMAPWGRDGVASWHEGCLGLGQALTITTPEARLERMPCVSSPGDMVFTAAGRVDNRQELARVLDIPASTLAQTADGELVRLSYLRWGEGAVNRIYGDWAFAAWHPGERRLFLARDHLGYTPLYYHVDERVFAFATSRRALLELKLCPVALDELYLAQILVSWPAYHGERTIHHPIRRLPPAHVLVVTPEKLDIRQYWHLENTPLLQLKERNDYVAAFLEVFDEAVRARLRVPPAGSGGTALGVTLSGGLDSGSIAATAALQLKGGGGRLAAYTSVPLSATGSFAGPRFGDELSFAEATVRSAGNIDLYPIVADGTSPVDAIREMLGIMLEPAHAAGNFYWMLQLEREFAAQGGKALLMGQMGNAGISWFGNVFSQPLSYQLRLLGWRTWLKDAILRAVPRSALAEWRLYRAGKSEWWRNSAINPLFARRLDLLERRLRDPGQPAARPELEGRLFVKPGRGFGGALHAEIGASYGIEVRDPSADARVLAFTFSVPDHVFIDPGTGMDRWLIREAMKGRLPDQVRLNRGRGLQAADLVVRLRGCAAQVDHALAELAGGPATEYLDVPYMCRVWKSIQEEDSPDSLYKSVTIITRGIMAGLFVNDFYR